MPTRMCVRDNTPRARRSVVAPLPFPSASAATQCDASSNRTRYNVRPSTPRCRPRPLVPPRPSKLDPFQKRVAELLDKYADITAQRVFEILCDEGFEGGYTAVKKYVRRVRPQPPPKPSRPTPVYGPGKMAESDWSPYELTYTDGSQELVQLFSYVLVNSKRKFYRAYRSYDTHALMQGHIAAFEHFGGAASSCKYDGQKAVVIRWEGHQPIYNPQFLAFATHYEFRPIALRGNPNARPNVERGSWTHEKSFLSAREFRDLDDFNGQLAYWLATNIDVRKRHGTTALERFAEEAPHLVPLPRHPYDTARVAYRLCSIDGFIDWLGNRYAVPYDHITDLLPVRITDRELFVYAANLECVATHELAPRGQGLKLDPHGFHRRDTTQPAIDLDKLRTTFEQMGEHSTEFFQQLSSGPPRHWGRIARRILTLRERFATKHLDAALAHATRFGAFTHEAVLRILEARHPPRTLDEYVSEQTTHRLETELGICQTAPRDLAEYDRLPSTLVHEAASVDGTDNEETTACPPSPAALDTLPDAPPNESHPTKLS